MAKWLIRVVCCLAILAICPKVSAAAELTVFGPQQYLRTSGSGNVYENQFSAQVGPAHLVVTVGNPDGSNGVSSASVFLNGVQLLYPDNFPTNSSGYQFPVNLSENNFLRVEIQGTPGDFLTILVTQADNIKTILASAGSGGSHLACRPGIGELRRQPDFSITPAANYHVADVLVDGVSVGAVTTYDFTNVTADHTIAASFAIDTFSITASAGANGSITPRGRDRELRDHQTFSLTPATGYHVADVLVDGVSVGAVTTYNFTNVTADHTIAASFAIDTFTITASAGANGSITPTRRRDGELRRQPDLHHHPGRRLPRGRRPGGRRLGGRGDQLHLHQRHRRPHHLGHLRHRHLHHHGQRPAPTAASRRPDLPVNYGANQTYTITPAASYHVADVLVDGVSVGAVTSYTFTNVTGQPHHRRPASPSTPTPSRPASAAPTAASRRAGRRRSTTAPARPTPSPRPPATTWPTCWWTASRWAR